MRMNSAQHNLNIRKTEKDYMQHNIVYSLCLIMWMITTVLLAFHTVL